MVDFTKEELLEIASWAMDKADNAKRCKWVNTFVYETAKSIFEKAHAEYFEKVKEEGF